MPHRCSARAWQSRDNRMGVEIFPIIYLKQTTYNLCTARGKLYIVHRKENGGMHVYNNKYNYIYFSNRAHIALYIHSFWGEISYLESTIMQETRLGAH